MNDLHPLLENRSDLEKLEQDLIRLTGPTASSLNPAIQLRVQSARRDLDMARAAHIEICFQLDHSDRKVRAVAKERLSQRIAAGEQKIYDPRKKVWRPALELWEEANKINPAVSRREVEISQFEAALAAAAISPRNLKRLAELIGDAEKLELHGILTADGQNALRQAHQTLEDGKKNHRQLSLQMIQGNLKERLWAIDGIQKLIADGETEILVAPELKWQPVDIVLSRARLEYENESNRLVELEIDRAGDLFKCSPDAALRNLYLALNKMIPYKDESRHRLEKFYFEKLEDHKNLSKNSPPPPSQINIAEVEGFQKVNQERRNQLKELFNKSYKWYSRHRSVLTPVVSKWLNQAELQNTSLEEAALLVDRAEKLARSQLEGSIEIPEVLVRGALILLNKNDPRRALEKLSRALPLYLPLDIENKKENIHRYAVTAWLLGCLEYYRYYMGEPLSGYDHWIEARKVFSDLYTQNRHERLIRKLPWYQTTLMEMDNAIFDTVDVGYFDWMNRFHKEQFPLWMEELRERMKTQLKNKSLEELKITIKLLLENARLDANPKIVYQSQVDAAFYDYQMHNNYAEALTLLELASAGYHFDHRHAVTLWLMGMIRWWFPSERPRAILNWEESIFRFEKLAEEADHSNEKEKRQWYQSQIGMMKSSLKTWINFTQT